MEVVRLKLDKAYNGLSHKTLFKEKLDNFISQINSKFIIERVYLNHIEKPSLQVLKENLLGMTVAEVIKSEITLQVKRK